MRQRLFNLAAAVSLVLCVATAALWVRSYQAYDRVRWGTKRDSWIASSARGELALSHVTGSHVEDPGLNYRNAWPDASPWPDGWLHTWRHLDVGGFVFWSAAHWKDRGQAAVFPNWSVLLVALVFPMQWFIRHYRRVSVCNLCPT
jgi:hypothetical protein